MAEKPLILFDGECAFCNWAINFILDKDKREIYFFSPYQSELGRTVLRKFGLADREVKTMYLLESRRLSSKSTAVLRILRGLPFPWKLMSVFTIVPKGIRDVIYDLIADNRYAWFGRMNSCKIPDERKKLRIIGFRNGNFQ